MESVSNPLKSKRENCDFKGEQRKWGVEMGGYQLEKLSKQELKGEIWRGRGRGNQTFSKISRYC